MKSQIKLTSKQYKALKPLERHLNRAYYGQYTIGLNNDDAELGFSIYNEIYNTKERSYSCARCRLRIFRELGKLYFSYKNKSNKDDGKQEETI